MNTERRVQFLSRRHYLVRRLVSTTSHSNKTPRFQVPVHVALFSMLLIPVGLSLGYATRYGKSEDDLEADIRSRYQDKLITGDSGIAEKNRHMGVYLQQVMRDKNPAMQQQLRAVLEGGKDAHTKGRQRQYDELGEQLRQAVVPAASVGQDDDDNESSLKTKKRKKKLKKKQKAEAEDAGVPGDIKSVISPSTAKTVASVTAVAAVAAIAGFVLGGSRRSS